MKAAHLSDIHYCEKYLDEADRCMAFAVERLRENRPDLIILTGDLFEHRLEQNSRAFIQAVRRVSELGCIAPVLILQGTFSHDAPGSLDVFRHVMSDYPIHVADRIQQVYLRKGFTASDGWRFSNDVLEMPTKDCAALVSCLPSINKGAVAAAVGAEDAAEAVGEQVAALLKGWSYVNQQARAAGIPTIVISHGTVSGCETEHGCPMAGLDHEFVTGSLFSAEASAVMLGHIHKQQQWERDGRVIAYAGSLGRLHFGEHDAKGFLLWDVLPDTAAFHFIETPAKRLVEITFDGPPDMDQLKQQAADAEGAHVRVRWSVDEEHRNSVDKAAIEALFETAAVVKLEGAIIPVQRQRAAGIGQAVTVADKLQRWCELTESEAPPLLDRLATIEADTPEKALESL